MAQLTIITSRRPATLSKTIRRGPDGGLVREAGGLLVEGEARVATVASLGELGVLLADLGPAQALTFGIPRGGDQKILSRTALASRPSADGITTRTRDRFAWPDGAGILMLDHDPSDAPVSREELVGMRAPRIRAGRTTRWSRRWPARSAGSGCWNPASSPPSPNWPSARASRPPT